MRKTKITGFHQDEDKDWVADLSCGHSRHFRHNPPFRLCEWVTSPQGRDEHIEKHSIGSVEFKPNRLLMFDGRIPHGADAPNSRARYADRCSIVLRGDEIELIEKEELYNANDRFHYI